MADARGIDIMEAAEYSVATSGSRPRDVGANDVKGSLRDASRTRLANGIPYKEFSSRALTSDGGVWGVKKESGRLRVDVGDVGDVDTGGRPCVDSVLCIGVRRLEATTESYRSDALKRDALTARRRGTFHRLMLELPEAVHNTLSSKANILLIPSDDAMLRSPGSWQMTMHSPSDTSEQSSTSTLHTKPVLSPE